MYFFVIIVIVIVIKIIIIMNDSNFKNYLIYSDSNTTNQE